MHKHRQNRKYLSYHVTFSHYDFVVIKHDTPIKILANKKNRRQTMQSAQQMKQDLELGMHLRRWSRSNWKRERSHRHRNESKIIHCPRDTTIDYCS
jgi:hypothetical protein